VSVPQAYAYRVTDLTVEVLGEGETVVLVHGSGPARWTDQRPLAERYRLVIPFRRGYGSSPAEDPDFEADGRDIAELLGDGAHVVGFSYGGIGSLLAAATRPDDVRSLTVIEPPAFGIAEDVPAVQEFLERLRPVYEHASELPPEEYDAAFDAALGFEHPPGEMDVETRAIVESIQRERPPWEAEIPFERLAEVRTLVVSGGWHPAFDAVCNVIEQRTGAERAVLPGQGHGATHTPGFNERLVAFWESG
jgi:pimeloyl-ACP methyl ester carboxylesterase